MRFQDTPIRQKLTTMTLLTSGGVLLLTCTGFIGYEFLTYRQSAVRELSTIGEIIAAQTTGAVAFDNQRDATEVLAALRAERHITAACLYNQAGKLFARYPGGAPDSTFPAAPAGDGYRFVNGRLIGFTPLVQVPESNRLGTLYLSSDMDAMYERLRLYGLIAVLVIGVSSSVAYALSRVLQRQISRPMLELADTAKAVSDRRDYSVRATKHGDDELGLLTEAFNHMLAQIEEQNTVLEQRVRERTSELEAANDELEAFCSSAAHDLRTPLRAITGFTDLLLDERAARSPEEMKRYLRLVRSGSMQMSQLIADLLSFSRLGRQEITRQSVDFNRLWQDVLGDFEGEIRQRGVDVRIAPLPTVHADPALLRVVCVNLFSNALKYSRMRTPAVIEIGFIEDHDEPGPVIFVRDNGVGFDMEHAEKLFGIFQRLHHAHEFEGTGVGLATVRRVVQRHGGRIWAEAETDVRATFFFSLQKA